MTSELVKQEGGKSRSMFSQMKRKYREMGREEGFGEVEVTGRERKEEENFFEAGHINLCSLFLF